MEFEMLRPNGNPIFFDVTETRRESPLDLRPLWAIVLEHNCYVAGGFVRWLVSPKETPAPYGDIDIFGWTEDAAEKLAEYLAQQTYFELEFESQWSWKFKYLSPMYPARVYYINIIKSDNNEVYATYGDPKVVVGRFDFTITMAYFTSIDEDGDPVKIKADFRFSQHEKDGRLVFNVVKHPLSTMSRIQRYIAKGYRMDREDMMFYIQSIIQHKEVFEKYAAWRAGDTAFTRNELRDDVYQHL